MNLDVYLTMIEAKSNGEYFMVRCPACGHKEGYIYKSDILKNKENPKHKIVIRCNRLNKCGITTVINEDLTINEEIIESVKKNESKQIGSKGVELLQNLVDIGYLLKGFDFDIRGIKNSILKKYKVLYLKDGWDKFLLGKKFVYEFEDKFYLYKNRDVIIPILNKEGNIQRFLLRSTTPNLPKKEIQVKIKRDAVEVWNNIDIYDEKKKILFVTEGVYDALSIVSVLDDKKISYDDIGLVSLPGIRKYKKVVKDIEQNIEKFRDKCVVIAFDSDEGGIKYRDKMIGELERLKVKYKLIDLQGFKDLNDFLQKDKYKFFINIFNLIMNIRKEQGRG